MPNLYLIPPFSRFPDIDALTDGYFLEVPWLMECRGLREYVMSRQFGKPLLLDNGVYEYGRPIEWKQLVDWAELLSSYFPIVEVALPDYVDDEERTLEVVKQYAHGQLTPWDHVIVCIQGKTASAAYKMFKRSFEMLGNTVTYAVPIHMFRKGFRLQLVKAISRYTKPHLFGLDQPWELLVLREHIRSVDTSLPFTYAYHGRMLTVLDSVEKLRRCDFYGDVVWQIAVNNVLLLKQILRGEIP